MDSAQGPSSPGHRRARRRGRPFRRTAGAIALAVAAIVSVTACSGGHSSLTRSSGQYATGGTFTLGVPVDLPSANPYAANTGSGQMRYLSYLAYDSLVNESAQGQFETGLASSWTLTASSATFRLRSGVTCSDGSTLTASQVATDLNYVGNPKNQYPWLDVLTPSVSYTATGDNATGVVRVTTASPFSFLLETVGDIPIVCARGMADPSSLTSHSDGTGPFVLQSVSPDSYTYAVRKGYTWGPGGASTSAPGTPGTVVLQMVTNPTTAANELLAGQLSATQVLGSDAERLIGQHLPESAVQVQAAGLYFTETSAQATSDVRVRQALTATLNFGQLVQVQSKATGQPATRSTGLRAGTPVPCAGASATTALPSGGAAAARRLLTQAGWKFSGTTWEKNGKPLQVTIAYEQAEEEPLAELIGQEWNQLGAKASLDLLTSQQLSAFEQGDPDFAVLIGASALSLPTEIEPEVSGPGLPDGQNIQAVSNPVYDKLAKQATATSGAAGCTLWAQAENAVMQRADIVPVANQPVALFRTADAEAQMSSVRQPIPTSIKVLK